jgi:hypothetical protein
LITFFFECIILQFFVDMKFTDENALMTMLRNETMPRRVVTATVHPGSVATNIVHPLIGQSASLNPLLRTARQAAFVILHAITSDTFLPGAYLDAQGRDHDLADFREEHLKDHLAAFPQAASLSFAQPPMIKIFSFDEWAFNRTQFISYSKSSTNPSAAFDKQQLNTALWEVSDKIVSNWESGKPLF